MGFGSDSYVIHTKMVLKYMGGLGGRSIELILFGELKRDSTAPVFVCGISNNTRAGKIDERGEKVDCFVNKCVSQR